MENLYEANCIRTYTGKYINVFDPKPEQILIEDIAHALSQMPRFGGHLPVFYSVAQHSIACMHKVSTRNALTALLHDASEAYLMDIPKPIKNNLYNYKEIEHALMEVIAKVFGFEYPLPMEVKQADQDMLVLEWEKIMIADVPYKTRFSMEQIEVAFLQAFHLHKTVNR